MKCLHCQAENTGDSRFCKNCARPLSSGPPPEAGPTATMETPREELTTGATFAGRYRIVEELGRGGMGRVYRAQDTKLNEEVALKLLKPEIATDKKALARFSNELKIARGIVHKNIGRMYEIMEEKGTSFITMEYVPGQDLKSLIRQTGSLTVSKTIAIAKQVCDGLGEAHKQGVVHRDLKPQNIMIDRSGSARILDFGIAHSLKTKGITGARVMIGTPEYMSPEQVDGKDVDPRSDIYALGAILFEMLTAYPPFEGDTAFTIGVKHKSEPPKDPREENPSIPEDLSRLILKCLAKNPDDRYADTAEICRELSLIKQGLPTTERTTVSQRTPLTSREITVQLSVKKLLVPALVFVAIIAAGIILWRVLLPRPAALPLASDKPTLAVLYFENNTGDAEYDHWRKSLAELITMDLSQSQYLSVLGGDRVFSILSRKDLLDVSGYSSEILKEVAAEGGVVNILRGSLTKAGDTFRIHAVLQNMATDELLGTERVECQGEAEIFSAVDELTRRIKADFKLSAAEIRTDIDHDVGTITTASAEALKSYTQGREYHLMGEYKLSIPFMEKAVEIDPGFAMAYRSMAVSYSNQGARFRPQSREKLEKAMVLSDRVSERERYMIEGTYYGSSPETYDKAIDAYTRLLELYPDASAARNNLGLKYHQRGEWEQAATHYEMLIEKEGYESYTTTFNLSGVYERLGYYDKARKVIEGYIAAHPEDARGYGYLAQSYAYSGDVERAVAVAEKAVELDPNRNTLSPFHGLQGKWEESERELLEFIENGNEAQRNGGNYWLEVVYRTRGRFDKAVEHTKASLKYAEKGGDVFNMFRFHWILALYDLESGRIDSALEHIAQSVKNTQILDFPLVKADYFFQLVEAHLAKGEIETAHEFAQKIQEMREQLHLAWMDGHVNTAFGLIEAKKENFSAAVEWFLKAKNAIPAQSSWEDPHAWVMFSLADAYYQAGELDKACAELEAIQALTSGRLYWGDLYARSFYLLGKFRQEQGRTREAVENFEKFLVIWKDADADRPELEDARRRLAALK